MSPSGRGRLFASALLTAVAFMRRRLYNPRFSGLGLGEVPVAPLA